MSSSDYNSSIVLSKLMRVNLLHSNSTLILTMKLIEDIDARLRVEGEKYDYEYYSSVFSKQFHKSKSPKKQRKGLKITPQDILIKNKSDSSNNNYDGRQLQTSKVGEIEELQFNSEG